MPTSRYTQATALGDDGKIYAFGGTANNEPLGAVEVFDPATGNWSTLPKMTPREGLAAFTGKDGRIYLLGGGNHSDIHPIAGVLTFKASTSEWSGIQSMQMGRENLAVAEGNDGKIYATSRSTTRRRRSKRSRRGA